MFSSVAIPKTRLDSLTYHEPVGLEVGAGDLVRVELRQKEVLGIVTGRARSTPRATKPILELVSKGFLPRALVSLLAWAADYYLAPLGIVLAHAVPAAVWRRLGSEFVPETPLAFRVAEGRMVTLNLEFDAARRLERWRGLIADALAQKRSVILLVPDKRSLLQVEAELESSFTPFFVSWSGEEKVRERLRAWQRAREGNVLVVGRQSAVFAPVPDLGLVIVETEHDEAYKSKQTPYYNARDVALMRGKLAGVRTVLASPRPSVEAYYQMSLGHYQAEATMAYDPPGPSVQIAPMPEPGLLFSDAALELLRTTLRAGAKAVVVQNRRGYSSYLVCRDCGHSPRCPQCELPLVFAAPGAALRCPYCAFRQTAYDNCPACGSTSFAFPGAGVGQAERRLRRLFPQAGVMRIDRPAATAGTRGPQILLGTRAVQDYVAADGVRCVIVVDADILLFSPDFRASERTFRLLSEILARTARTTPPRAVVIQTRFPQHHALSDLVRPEDFYRAELAERTSLNNPPLSRLGLFTAYGSSAGEAEQAAEKLMHRFKFGVRFYGPFAPRRARDRRGYRSQILVKVPRGQQLRRLFDRAAVLDPRRAFDVCVDPLEIG